MCQIAAEQGQDAIALTDHGTLGGAWKFAKAAKEVGIKPIQGCELYLSLGAREERNEEIEPRDDEGDTDADDDSHGKTTGGGDTKTRRYQHLTVLAGSTQGWDSLVRIQSAAHSSFWYKPRADFDLLARHSDGLIVFTGCLGGPVASKLKRGDYEGARANLGRLIEAVGKDNVYVEVMDHGIAAERKVTGGLVDLAREFWGPADYEKRVVATNDAHYPRDTDAAAHDAWLAVGVNRKMADTNRFAFKGTGYFIRSAEQMRGIFDDGNGTGKAVDTTLDIAERCSGDVLPASELRLPQFPALAEFTGTAAAYLKQQVKAGAQRRYGSPLPQEVRDRLNFEFTIISDMGLADYFLIVADIIDASRKHGVRVGPGRGSSAGALVSYCLEIVNVDPLAHGLLFERFLDPARVGMPDVDIDFDTVGRDWAINYAVTKYGADRVARIGTFGMALSRQAIKNAARVLDHVALGNELSKLVPIVADGKPMAFDHLDDENYGASAAFRAKATATDEAKAVVELARSFEGVVSQEGIHACGVVIADAPFDGLVPLRWDHRKGAEEDTAVTAWDGKDMDDAGFLKLDFLGLRNLDIISAAVRLIESTTGEVVDADNPPTDPTDERVRATWAGIRAGRTAGLFQLDGAGMTRLCEQIAPESVADLSAIIALYRPGPLGAKMDEHYVARKRGEEDVDYAIYTADPAEQAVIASVLDDTYGVPIYQEELMQLGELVAGFGPAEKNRLRKAFSKKKRPEMEAMRSFFVDGAQAELRDEAGNVVKMVFAVGTAEKLWETFDASAEYIFNKSHSVAYGQTAYITAYLKANWPSQYGAALLAVTAQDDKRQGTLNALRAEGITVTPPSLQLGGVSTTTAPDGSVRLGMREIKGVGDAARWIVAEREENGPFGSVRDLLCRVKVPATPGGPLVQNLGIGAVDGLIEAGALDEFGSRLGLRMALRAERDNGTVAMPDMEWGSLERSARERDRLGLALSAHPLAALKDQIREWRPPGMAGKTRAMSNVPVAIQNIGSVDGAEILTLGVLAGWAERSYSRGRMARITLEGSTSSVDGVLWDETLLALKADGDLPAVGSIVALRGKVTVTTVDTGDDGDSEDRWEVTVWQMWKVTLDDDARLAMPAASAHVPLRRITAIGVTPAAPATFPTTATSPPSEVPTEPTDTHRSSPAAAENPEPEDTGREVVRLTLLLDKTDDAATQLSTADWEHVREQLFPTYPWRLLESRIAETPGGTDLEVFATPDGRLELLITVCDEPVSGDNLVITSQSVSG